MIPQSNISRLSNRLQRESGGRKIPEHVVERDYCIAWFLVGLSLCDLRKQLAFKGGTALKRCYFAEYRFSEDLDFTLVKSMDFETLKKELDPVYAKVNALSGIKFRFSKVDGDFHQNSYTFYLAYEGPLLAAAAKEIKVDVTLKEKITDKIKEVAVLKSYPEYTDLPEDAKIKAYSLDEVATEKTVALLDRARTEPRDLYDLWHLTKTQNVDLADLISAIEEKLEFRGKKLKDVSGEFDKKEDRLEKTWNSRLSQQMATLPEFEEVYRAVKRSLRQAGITEKK